MTKEHCGTKYKEYQDMFNYISRKCNFHEDDKGKTTWTCNGDLRFAEAWCKYHKMDFQRIKHILEFFGGHCDCEVLFNVDTDTNEKMWEIRGLMIMEKLK